MIIPPLLHLLEYSTSQNIHYSLSNTYRFFGAVQFDAWLFSIQVHLVAYGYWERGAFHTGVAFALFAWASWYSLRHKRRIQHALGALVDPVRKMLLHRAKSKQHYRQTEITSFFWVNGRPPENEEYTRLAENDFATWKLDVCGLVAHPLHLSLDDLRKRPKQTQITKHNCIQGWSGVAEWAGVPLANILDECEPLPEAGYLVFTSYQKGKQSVKPELKEAQEHTYYEVIGEVSTLD
jgi:DMSO/TMAO reductase YedYZ molybdopterin-dependent catalytic subunit